MRTTATRWHSLPETDGTNGPGVVEESPATAGKPPPRPKAVPHLTLAERAARGKAARADLPRSAQAEIEFPKRRDPLSLLEEQAVSRVPELVQQVHSEFNDARFISLE